ncbi:hypothetical protein [Kribbella sp. NPDC050470]|uniref:hypothetical protein n=1 Tax=unclassified Kribbella TaxID=2644121 RepID=UPI0037AB650C
MTEGIWLRFLSGPGIDGLGLTRLEIVDAVEAAVREHGEGRTSFEPRVHLMPNNGGIGQSGRFGALRRHVDTGRLSPQTLYGEIGEIVAGRRPGRENDAERTLFWHRGQSLLDVAIAHLILRKAEAADAGTMLRFH